MKNFIHKKGAALQVIDSVNSVRKSRKTFEPHDNFIPGKIALPGTQWSGLGLSKPLLEIDTVMDPGKQELLRASSAPIKDWGTDRKNCIAYSGNDEKETYRKAVIKELEYISFVGLPTRNYQRQQLMVKPELEKLYINVKFYRENDDSQTSIPLDKIMEYPESNRMVILGEQGSGKTTLAKHLALLSLKNPRDNKSCTETKLPFIVYLSGIHGLGKEKLDLFEFLMRNTEDNYNLGYIGRDFFENRLEKQGVFVLFDGLDEIEPECVRTKISKAIESFSEKYFKCRVWVTCRPTGYTDAVRFDSSRFCHYHLAPVNREQAMEFVKTWYEIQVSKDTPFRAKRIQSLQVAIEQNKTIGDLARNPLILSMMVLLHQFEGTISENRAVLFEKSIELLLKTWQDQKYTSIGLKNPLEEKGLIYDVQLRLLSSLAYDMRMNEDRVNAGPLVIEATKLEQVLFENRYDERRMQKKKAREDVHLLLEYIHNRTGLLVQKGQNADGEKLFSFFHPSFGDYLCAYRIAKDKSKSQTEIITDLLDYMKYPGWHESILFSLYLLEKTNGASFIDAFTFAAFKKLNKEKNSNSWYLLGLAVRDNIDIAPVDIRLIISELFIIRLESVNHKEKDTTFFTLKQIALFSQKGRNILKKFLKKNINSNHPQRAAEAAYLLGKIF